MWRADALLDHGTCPKGIEPLRSPERRYSQYPSRCIRYASMNRDSRRSQIDNSIQDLRDYYFSLLAFYVEDDNVADIRSVMLIQDFEGAKCSALIANRKVESAFHNANSLPLWGDKTYCWACAQPRRHSRVSPSQGFPSVPALNPSAHSPEVVFTSGRSSVSCTSSGCVLSTCRS
jgi:hypothetical protein